MTAVCSLVAIDITRQTRQIPPRDTAAGAFFPPEESHADDTPPQHRFHLSHHPSHIVPPLSAPDPAGLSLASPPSPIMILMAPSTSSATAPRPGSSSPRSLIPTIPSIRPGGSKYRSVSASPATRSRYSNHHLSHVASSGQSSSAGNRSSTAANRARLLAMEAEKISWEAEKAGYMRHIQVLEEKLKEAIVENEELRENLDAIISRDCSVNDDLVQVGEEYDISQQAKGELCCFSPPMDRGRAPSSSTFVPHDNIPGTALPAPALTTCDEAVIETHLETMTSPGGTTISETTVSATVFHSEATQETTQWQAPPPTTAAMPTETMDVSTINPELEGIRLKSAAIQRPTFSLSQTSPPPDPVNLAVDSASGPGSEQAESPPSGAGAGPDVSASRKISKAQTQHVLATAESGRLKMYAGHTPSHSVSHFPALVAEEVADAALGAAREAAQELASQEALCRTGDDRNDEEDGDVPLRGHLIAQSDGTPSAFLDEFTRKLQNISSGADDGMPSVLKNPAITLDEAVAAAAANVYVAGTIEGYCGDADVSMVEVDQEIDIPLKLKPTTNFGLPWGQLGRGRNSIRSGLFAVNG